MIHRHALDTRSAALGGAPGTPFVVFGVWLIAGAASAPLAESEAHGQVADAAHWVRLNEAIQHFDRGEYAEAAAAFAERVADRPADIGARYYLALTRLQLGVRSADADERRRFFTLASQALASTLDEAPSLVEARIDLGIAQLGLRGGESAAARVLEEYVATPQGQYDAYGFFFLAVARYRLELDEAAAEALARVDALDDTLTPYTRFYRGLILTRARRTEEAHQLFADVTTLAPGSALAQRAEALSREAGRETGSAFGGTIRIGSDYDTNVVLLGDNTRLPTDLSGKDDFRFGVETDFSFSLALPPESLTFGRSLTVGIAGTTYQSWHTAVDEFDVQTYGGRAFVNFEPATDVFLGIQYDYDYNLVGRSPFLSRNRITPIVKIIEWRDDGPNAPGDPRTWTNLYYSFEDRDYFETIADPRLDRDGAYHTVGILQEFNLERLWPDDARWLAARLGFRFHRASTQGDDFDVNANTLSAGLDVPLPWDLLFDVSGEWSWEAYSQPSTIDFGRDARSDFVQRYLFGLTKQINANLSIRAEVNLIFDDSNVRDRRGQTPFSYDRSIWGISVLYGF